MFTLSCLHAHIRHRTMISLPYSELPPLAYQLLVLSTRGHKSLVLERLQSLFNQLDKKALEDDEESTR